MSRLHLALLLGPAAALASPGAAPFLGVAGLIGLVVGWRQRKAPSSRALDRWRLANASALVLCMLAVAMGAPVLVVALSLVLWLSVHRATTGQRAEDDRIALLLGLLQLLLACVLSVSVWLLPIFLAWGALLPLALIEVQSRAEAEAAGSPSAPSPPPRLLAPVALGLTVAFFVGLPRVSAEVGALSAETVTGFGDEVDLSRPAPQKDNPEVVARAQISRLDGPPPTGPFYLRGRALDHFDGQRWTATLGGEVRRQGRSGAATLKAQITLEPGPDTTLIGPAPLLGFSGLDAAVTVDTNGNWAVEGIPRRLRYTALSAEPRSGEAPLPLHPAERAGLEAGVWLSLPAELDPRIPALAATLRAEAGEDPRARAEAALAFLDEGFTYTIDPPASARPDPLAHFLFVDRTGHCELFASALAVLLRADGQPARVVNGLYGGEWSELAQLWIFRQRDAHTWVERWDPALGWHRLDATPAGAPTAAMALIDEVSELVVTRWHRVILDYNLQSQLELGQQLVRPLSWVQLPDGGPASDLFPDEGAVVLVTLLVFGGVLGGSRLLLRWAGARRGTRTPQSPLARPLAKAQGLIARRGWRLPAGSPPLEAAEWLLREAGPAAAPFQTLAWLHYRAHYGGEPAAPLLPEAAAALRALDGLPAAPVDEAAPQRQYRQPHPGRAAPGD